MYTCYATHRGYGELNLKFVFSVFCLQNNRVFNKYELKKQSFIAIRLQYMKFCNEL